MDQLSAQEGPVVNQTSESNTNSQLPNSDSTQAVPETPPPVAREPTHVSPETLKAHNTVEKADEDKAREVMARLTELSASRAEASNEQPETPAVQVGETATPLNTETAPIQPEFAPAVPAETPIPPLRVEAASLQQTEVAPKQELPTQTVESKPTSQQSANSVELPRPTSPEPVAQPVNQVVSGDSPLSTPLAEFEALRDAQLARRSQEGQRAA